MSLPEPAPPGLGNEFLRAETDAQTTHTRASMSVQRRTNDPIIEAKSLKFPILGRPNQERYNQGE